MALPDESADEGDADATPTVASANGATASAMTAGSLTTLAVGVTDAIAGAIDSAATGAAEVSEGQEDVAGVADIHATSALHVLDSEGYASGDQPVLISTENYSAGAQQTSGESHGSPVEEGSAAVVPTPVIALPFSRIQDRASGATRRGNHTSLTSSPQSPDSEDSQSSSSEEGAIGGVTKRSCCKSVEKNVSKDQRSSGTSVDVSSIMCSICYERYKDSVCCPCGHMGCYPCIQQWLLLSDPLSSCHVCRQKVESVQTPIVLCNLLFEPCFTNY
jgi:hypothetical protein